VQEHVPTRDGPKCREKWHNVVNPALIQGPWTAEDDTALELAVAEHGAGKWAKVADHAFHGTRTDDMCKRRWGKLAAGEAARHLKVTLRASSHSARI